MIRNLFIFIFMVMGLSTTAHAQNACLAIFSDRAPVLLGEGQGGVVHRVFIQGTGFIARKIYFEKEELLNDQRALEVLRGMKISNMRLVRWLNREELVVDMQYVDGIPLTASSSKALMRDYEQYLTQVRDIFQEQFFGIKHLDFYQSREDGMWRLSVFLRDKDGVFVRILLRPDNFIITQDGLVLIDPH